MNAIASEKSRAASPRILLESFDPIRGGQSFLFENPVEWIEAHRVEDVVPSLDRIDEGVASGLHAAGMVTYEAAPAFDPAMKTQPPGELPLLAFGLFRERRKIEPESCESTEEAPVPLLSPEIGWTRYEEAFQHIQDHLEAGDTYQVNYTYRLRARWEHDPFALHRRLCRSQASAYCGWLQWGPYRILSASPELFFSLKDQDLTVRPMKGTAPRGRWLEEDEEFAQTLHRCPKNRAENVMIVDLLRNDLGRIAQPGSVRVEKLFEIERYETVLQMTSTITARGKDRLSLAALFQALFPCGSVTGAPKIRTMEIIKDMESSPRGVYTGAIGYFSPGPEAVFSVAIRTGFFDTRSGMLEFGVGGGITRDSTPDGEFQECSIKAKYIRESRPAFDLLETLLYEKGSFPLLLRHLGRMEKSARYFGYGFPEAALRSALRELGEELRGSRARIRLLLSSDGTFRLEHRPFPPPNTPERFRVILSQRPVNSSDVFLFHKTTHREVYTSRAREHPEWDDVLLINERGELTESTVANLAVQLEGRWWTPPRECGLLAGTFRDELVARGELAERVLRPADLERAESIRLINSVRGWIEVKNMNPTRFPSTKLME